MNDSERLDYLIRHLEGGNMKAFARKTGITYTTLSRIRHGEFKIASRTQKILDAYPVINRLWLVSGEGYSGDISASTTREHYQRLLAERDETIRQLVNEIENQRQVIKELTKQR